MASYWWSALLLLIGACTVLQIGIIIQFVHSDLTVGFNIEMGDLLSEALLSDSAVAKLSSGPYQQGWWKLANATWHDFALVRFFAKGPLNATEMKDLASKTGTSDSWAKSKVVNVTTKQKDLMFALQKYSTVTYQINKTIPGTGRIEASMSTLVFRCIGARSCHEGYFVPMLPVPRSRENQAGEDYSYHSLWLHLANNLLVNAIPSSIPSLQRHARSVPMPNKDDPELSVVVNVYNTVAECPPTAAALLAYRSLLDASYGLVPGLACINFGTDDQPFKLIIFLVLFFNNATEPRDISLTTLEDFFSAVSVRTGQWKQLPFEECSEEGVLIRSSQDPNSLKMCYKNVCVTNYIGNGTCTKDGVQHLRFLHSITTLSESCTVDGGKPLHARNDTAPIQVSCHMHSANDLCSATVDVSDTNFTYSINPLRLLSPQSNWISTEGNNTSEFNYAPNTADFDDTRMCVRTPSSLSPLFLSNTTQAAFLQAIQIKASTYLHSFIAQHNIAFMTIKGPASGFQSFLVLIVSTAISVILTIAGPFPNFLLKRICRIRPLHLDSQRSRVSKVVNVSFQMICNMLLSFCLFLPVLYMAWSELDRESPFQTWDLGSNDQFIYNSFGSDTQLRVVYLLSATSKYGSRFIIASALVACITCFIGGASSAWRSKEVFDRYALLQKCGNMKEQLDREALYVRALRAIEMTEGEYLALKAEYLALKAEYEERSSYFSRPKKRFLTGTHTVHSPRESPTSAFLVGYSTRS